VARISGDGTVEDESYDTLLYTDGSDDAQTAKIAAYLVFFSGLLVEE